MCIRDRAQLRAAGRYGSYLLYTEEGALVRVFIVYCWAGAAERLQTVSYTHLTLPTICSV
eukprot:9939999-Alexandrium_andersonii.AAC.1